MSDKPDGYVLSEEDVKLLKRLARAVKHFPTINPPQRPPGGQTGAFIDEEEYPTPEMYIAKTPLGGIPFNTTFGSIGAGDEPGYAECQILRLAPTVPGVKSALRVAFTRKVFNLSTVAIEGEKWIIAVRDKWGDWFALPLLDDSEPGTGAGGDFGTGSGSGTLGTGTLASSCCHCFDDPYSEPDGLDPEIQVETTSPDPTGTYFLVYARIRIVCDPHTGRARNQLYDYRYETRCALPCPTGTGTVPGTSTATIPLGT